MGKRKILDGTSIDGMLLAGIRLLTTMFGIFSTMLLSKSLSLMVYGTYSQANLVISLGTSFSVLGLTDGAIYFFNKAKDTEESQCWLNTVFAIQICIGVLFGFGIIMARNWIIAYYQNSNLAGLFIYIAFRPLLNNLIAILQVLQVSIGRAKVIAIRNIVLAIAKILAIYVAVIVVNDIKIIFITLLILDVLTVWYFWTTFEKEKYQIQIWKSDKSKVKEIIKFCVPMGVYVLTNSLSRDIDKVCIAYFAGTEKLAIYTNCSTILPVDIISAAFLTVVIPIMTRLISSREYQKSSQLFSYYIQLGYLTTLTFSAAIFTLSSETISFLYGNKYLSGQPVFLLYMLVSGLRFASLSLVLSANGETKKLMYISVLGLVANLCMNIFLFYILGFIGPAVATVLITIVTIVILLHNSVKVLKCNINDVLNYRQVIKYLAKLIPTCLVFRLIANAMNSLHFPGGGTLILSTGGICAVMFILNGNEVKNVLKGINEFR